MTFISLNGVEKKYISFLASKFYKISFQVICTFEYFNSWLPNFIIVMFIPSHIHFQILLSHIHPKSYSLRMKYTFFHMKDIFTPNIWISSTLLSFANDFNFCLSKSMIKPV